MKVEWLNFRLTFQSETLEEHAALRAVWVAFGSQVDDSASREVVDLKCKFCGVSESGPWNVVSQGWVDCGSSFICPKCEEKERIAILQGEPEENWHSV